MVGLTSADAERVRNVMPLMRETMIESRLFRERTYSLFARGEIRRETVLLPSSSAPFASATRRGRSQAHQGDRSEADTVVQPFPPAFCLDGLRRNLVPPRGPLILPRGAPPRRLLLLRRRAPPWPPSLLRRSIKPLPATMSGLRDSRLACLSAMISSPRRICAGPNIFKTAKSKHTSFARCFQPRARRSV
jgi:hypothetical protein